MKTNKVLIAEPSYAKTTAWPRKELSKAIL